MRDAWSDLVLGAACLGCGTAGRPLCDGCAVALPGSAARVRPDPCPPGLAPAYAAGEYADLLRALILVHKERHGFALTRPLGAVLAGVVGALPLDGPVVLVPVPSRGSVVRSRGHDPMLRITRAAAARARRRGRDVRVVPLLRQRMAVADQAGLDARARAANLAGSLAVAPGPRRALARRRPGHVVVCDDVITTGATLREAQRALEDGGIVVAALACVAATRKRIGDSLPFSPAPH